MENQAKPERKRKTTENSYFKHGLMIFIVGVLLITTYLIMKDPTDLQNGFSNINKILRPFYLGLVMAYLICPIYNIMTRGLNKIFSKNAANPMGKGLKISKTISSILSVILIILILAGIVMLIVPDLIANIIDIVPNIQPAFQKVITWISDKLSEHPDIASALSLKVDDLSQDIYSWAKNTLLPAAQGLLTQVSQGAIGTIGVLKDFVIALFLTIYFLNGKEMFLALIKKIIISIFNKQHSESILELGGIANTAFGGFINGKIIDSVIIGILCAIAMPCLGLPCVALVSVVIGVTNVIPFFGPIIGAIPMGLLMLLVSPMSCLKFLILVVVLQTLDGYVIGPKILGNSTHLSSSWVMFAIILFGGFFGILGMIVGVPIFAIIYAYVARIVNRKLDKKGYTTRTTDYYDLSKYQPQPHAPVGKKMKSFFTGKGKDTKDFQTGYKADISKYQVQKPDQNNDGEVAKAAVTENSADKQEG